MDPDPLGLHNFGLQDPDPGSNIYQIHRKFVLMFLSSFKFKTINVVRSFGSLNVGVFILSYFFKIIFLKSFFVKNISSKIYLAHFFYKYF